MPRSPDHARYVTEETHDPRDRFGLYRLCDCTTCEGNGKVGDVYLDGRAIAKGHRCSDCRGEGRVRQEIASCESPEAVGVALVTLGREQEWEGCAFGLLDRIPECERCEGRGHHLDSRECLTCQGTGDKPSGTWLVLPWLPSPRNASDAGKLLRSRRK